MVSIQTQILLIANTKGGAGKSTVSANLSVERAKQVEAGGVLLIDADRQGNSSNWAHARAEENIEPIIHFQHCYDEKIKSVLNQSKNYQDIIIDSGGYDSVALRSSMVLADKMIIPLRPGQFDIEAIELFNQLYKTANETRGDLNKKPLPAAFLLNMKSAHKKSKANSDIENYIKDYGKELSIGFMLSEVVFRAVFGESVKYGLAVSEMKKKDSQAIDEIENVYHETWNSESKEWKRRTAIILKKRRG